MIFFFKQKTAYEMRISDWSSDVCSSDLHEDGGRGGWRSRFNVAIRTLRLTPETSASEGSAVFGVGSGIVADSVVEDEWEECLLKARFVDRAILNAQNSRLSSATISRSEEPTSDFQSLMRISSAAFCLKNTKK